MDLDPHTVQQILQKIYQQMRCPQCGSKVPVDLSDIRLVADGSMLLQLKCDSCESHVVLQAALNGLDKFGAPPYEQDETRNASTGFETNGDDLTQIRERLSEGKGFKEMFVDLSDTDQEEAKPETDIA